LTPILINCHRKVIFTIKHATSQPKGNQFRNPIKERTDLVLQMILLKSNKNQNHRLIYLIVSLSLASFSINPHFFLMKNVFFLLLVGLFVSTTSSAQSNYFWYEGFADGFPAGWTTSDVSAQGFDWEYCANPNAGAACSVNYWGSATFLASTAQNGMMLLDSDNGLPSPGLPESAISQLTTPAIDASTYSQLFLRFESRIRTASAAPDSTAIVRVSTDNVTWTEFLIFPLLSDDIEQTSANPEVTIIDLTSIAAGQPTVYIQWQWTNNWEYQWLLDDVSLHDATPVFVAPLEANELTMTSPFYPFPSYATPVSHVDCDPFVPFGFRAVVVNGGSETQTGTVLVELLDGATVLHAQTLTTVPLATGETDTLSFETYTPTLSVGEYNIRYTLTNELGSDAIPLNNFSERGFIITDSTFAKSDVITIATAPSGASESWSMINIYNTCSDLGEYTLAKEVTFTAYIPASLGSLNGKSALIFLAKEDPNATFDDTDLLGGGALTIVGEVEVPMSGNGSTFVEFTGNLNDINSGSIGVPLEPSSAYYLIVQFNGASSACYGGWNEEYDYTFASTLIFSGQYFGGFTGTTGGFKLDLNLSKPLPISTNDQLPTTAVNIVPNPTSDFVNLVFDLDAATDATITVTDINGRTIETRTVSNIANGTESMSVAAFPAGTYFARVITAQGSITKPFTVVK
jgi:Secretion system C-terminal sorting domain